jgi:hypothetical protein
MQMEAFDQKKTKKLIEGQSKALEGKDQCKTPEILE